MIVRRRFVIDASVTLAWLFDEDSSANRIGAILDGAELVAPWLWRLEVVNVILVRERRKLLSIARGAQLLELLEDWAVEMMGEPPSRSLTGLAAAARPHQLSAYDAIYLDVAMSQGLPLFTGDNNLRNTAVRIGLPLVTSTHG
jgi:predicted nucleic acid-binding protein